MQEFLNNIINWATGTGVKIVVAIIILIVAFKLINVLGRKITKKLEAGSKLDATLTKTLSYIVIIGLKVLVVVCLIGYLGIETSGISALIASLGVGVGLAVNGTLANLAGGAMILITRPFKIGDYISAMGNDGTVEEIRICNTKLLTVDNKVIYLPNSALSTGTIVNYSEQEDRRVDLKFSVAGNDPKKVQKVLLGICENDSRILKDPAPFVRVTDFGAGNGMTMTVRVWCKSADYWDVYLGFLDAAEAAFAKENIVVPFNQLDVHMK